MSTATVNRLTSVSRSLRPVSIDHNRADESPRARLTSGGCTGTSCAA